MVNKQWWTCIGQYQYGHSVEDTGPYSVMVEAKDRPEARTKALDKAEYTANIWFILPGKVKGISVEDLDNVMPIRGKKHEIEVTHVRIARRKFFIPGRCPGCKKDLRRANAMLEKYVVVKTWAGHLSHNNKDFVHERDFVHLRERIDNTFNTVMLLCSDCKHVIWDGLHADE